MVFCGYKNVMIKEVVSETREQFYHYFKEIKDEDGKIHTVNSESKFELNNLKVGDKVSVVSGYTV